MASEQTIVDQVREFGELLEKGYGLKAAAAEFGQLTRKQAETFLNEHGLVFSEAYASQETEGAQREDWCL